MSTQQPRRILLLGLVILLGLVWWRSFSFLYTRNDERNTPSISERDLPTLGEAGSDLVYREPKVNPFGVVRAVRNDSVGKVHTIARVTETQPIDGVLIGSIPGAKPQAIVRLNTGQSIVMAIGDNVGVWHVLTIRDTYIIVQNKKQFDTLRIGHDR